MFITTGKPVGYRVVDGGLYRAATVPTRGRRTGVVAGQVPLLDLGGRLNKGTDRRLNQWGGPVAQLLQAKGVMPYCICADGWAKSV